MPNRADMWAHLQMNHSKELPKDFNKDLLVRSMYRPDASAKKPQRKPTIQEPATLSKAPVTASKVPATVSLLPPRPVMRSLSQSPSTQWSR